MVSRDISNVERSLIGLTSKQLKDRSIVDWQGKPSRVKLFGLFNVFHDHYSNEQLYDIIHEFTDKWPHASRRWDLAILAACVVEEFHFEYVMERKPTKKMVEYMNDARGRAQLRNVPKPNSEHQMSDEDLDPFS